jgi:hypothetical protein
MHKHQYDTLRTELGIGDYGWVTAASAPSLYITTGRQKGKLGRVLQIDHSRLTVQAENHPSLTFPYTALERVDAAGEPIILDAFDITGRAVTGSAVVCYSVSAGTQSHALEIGRVIKTNPSGTLSVQPVIRNGVRLVDGYGLRTRSLVRADRVILLPVDATLVTTWVLSGFSVYQADELLR